jgi:hypothetical protein
MGAGRKDGLIAGFRAGAAIAPHRFVKFGADDNTVVQAAAATDAIIGVSSELAVTVGQPVDVHMGSLADVTYGGNVGRGALLTSDADGKAVAAAPGAGVNHRIGGLATREGVAGDIGTVLIGPGQVQG